MQDNEADVLKALEQGIRAGGTDLPRKKLGLANDRQGAALLRDLCDKGYMADTGKGKFSLTENGLTFWQKKCGPGRYQNTRDQVIQNFLEILQKKSGKKLPARQLRYFLPQWLQDAERLKLCEKTGPGSYRLLPDGEEFLLSRLPAAKRLEIKRSRYQKKVDVVRQLRAELTGQLTALHNDVVREFYQLQQQESQLQAINAQFGRHLEVCDSAYGESIRALADALSLVDAARIFREQVIKDGEEAKAQMESSCREIGERLRALEIMVLKKLGDIEQNLAKVDVEDLVQERLRLASMSGQLAEIPEQRLVPVPLGSPPDFDQIKLEGMDDEEIFCVAGEIHRQYCHIHPETGGTMPIPELFEGLKKRRSVVELKVLHDFLIQWMHQGRISLWVCSTPGLEPRADMGIPSERGLLFYVRMR